MMNASDMNSSYMTDAATLRSAMRYLCVYGSLLQGEYNHAALLAGIEPVARCRLPGYSLWAYSESAAYPYAAQRTLTDEHDAAGLYVEVYATSDLPDSILLGIHNMEIGAGYTAAFIRGHMNRVDGDNEEPAHNLRQGARIYVHPCEVGDYPVTINHWGKHRRKVELYNKERMYEDSLAYEDEYYDEDDYEEEY